MSFPHGTTVPERPMKRPSLRGYTFAELKDIVHGYGEQAYRAAQVAGFLFDPACNDWSCYSSLSKTFREKLSADFPVCSLVCVERYASRDGQTVKYLLATRDGARIESVLILADDRATVCVSTQVGCKYGCAFCMSGSNGFVRNLDAAEILDQIFILSSREKKTVTNIVIMGMGEPFDNYDEAVRAVRIMNDPYGFHIGARHITISTVGVCEGIERFSREGLEQIKLAISLHAAREEVRSALMPVSKVYPLAQLTQTLLNTRDQFRRSITFEYVLLDQINDAVVDARALADLAHKVSAKVNLIIYNQVIKNGRSFKPSSPERQKQFEKELTAKKVIYTIRRSGGTDIAAACGQLSCRKKELEGEEK